MIKSKFRLILDGILIPFLVYVGITMFVAFIYGIVYGVTKSEAKINAIFVQGIADAFVVFGLLPLYMFFIKKYAVHFERVTVKNILYTIPLAFSICILCNIFIQFIPNAANNQVSKEIIEMTETYNIWVSILLISIFVPIVEELLFRGFFYDVVDKLKGPIYAIVITSIAFGIAHFNIEQGIYGLLAGLLLSYVRYKFGNLSYTIVMHLLMNFCSLVFVSPILNLNDIREKMFVAFICAAILALTLYRINMRK